MKLPAPPPLLRDLLARLPQYPPTVVVAVALNALLGTILNGRNLPQARGKVIALDVRDMGLKLAFAVEDEGLVARGNVQPDATISADARDFLALARREQDPDTLFFNRRLVMQGDTELALLIKNTLDAVDFRALEIPRPTRVLNAFALQWRARP
jgi:predicted lipid carrier protein YhbT